jgi:hypothetical protein
MASNFLTVGITDKIYCGSTKSLEHKMWTPSGLHVTHKYSMLIFCFAIVLAVVSSFVHKLASVACERTP